MKLFSSKKEKITFAAALLIVVLYTVFAQFYYLSPLKSDLKQKQQTLASEQKLVESLQQKNSSNNQTSNENTSELQKEVPVKPLQDQFILDLQQAETVSDSQIKTMSFTEGGQVAAAATQNNSTQQQTTNSNSSSTQQSTSQSTSGTSQQDSNQTASTGTTTAAATQQSALNKLTAQLSIVSPSYEELEKLINTLESLKRITVVEAITYTGPEEIKAVTDTSSTLTYTLTVSTYYLPGLTDLEKQLPKVDYPAPANKENPLSRFADITTP